MRRRANRMIERRRGRLDAIFALWFLAAALIPSLFLIVFSYRLQRDQAMTSAVHELATVARIKETGIRELVEQKRSELRDLTIQLDEAVANGNDASAAIQRIMDEYAQTSGSTAFFVTQSEMPTNTGTVYLDAGELHVRASAGLVMGSMVSALTTGLLNESLHRDVNDSLFFSRPEGDATTIGVGRTADLMLASADATLITASLVNEGATAVSDGSIHDWITSGEGSSAVLETELFGSAVLAYARRFELDGLPVALIASMSQSEVLARLYENQRNLIVLYISSLIAVLGVLYLFVGNLSRILVQPITRSIAHLVESAHKLREGISVTQRVTADQEEVSLRLSKNYRDQLRDIQRVNGEIESIVASLRDVQRLTGETTKSARDINQRAVHSQQDAQETRESLKSIRGIAIAHDALVEALASYGRRVDDISHEMRSLSHAISYVSMNAGIEACKTEGKLSSVTNLVSEVGKLARMSRDASTRITDLVALMQRQLRETKGAAARERRDAEESLQKVDRALTMLTSMSRAAISITKNITAIDRQISKQSESTSAIAEQSRDLTEEARGVAAVSRKVHALSGDQQKGMQANTLVARRLTASINKLSRLIGISVEKK